jgi:hypothetical protein
MVPTQPTYDQKGGHRADAQARSACRIETKKHPLRVRYASPKGVLPLLSGFIPTALNPASTLTISLRMKRLAIALAFQKSKLESWAL